jgi:protoporphyrinogen IX oxidase
MYEIAKTLHIVSVIIWIGGMLFASILLARQPTTAVPSLRAVFRVVLTPAMLAVWALGLYLAISGGWFSQGWLHGKLLVVVILSGLHGMLIGQMRKAEVVGFVPGGMLQAMPWMLGVGALVAVGLVELQPF